MRTFRLEKHESCRCECVQQSSDCNEHQEYRPDECRCACRDSERRIQCLKKQEKTWLPDSCECKCSSRPTCPTGTVFSEETCKCHVSADSSRFAFNQFPLIHFHSSIDLEIKKQQEFPSRLGSSTGIDPDNHRSFNQFVLQDESSSQQQEGNGLFVIHSN